MKDTTNTNQVDLVYSIDEESSIPAQTVAPMKKTEANTNNLLPRCSKKERASKQKRYIPYTVLDPLELKRNL